jgi:hypothetical protein
MNKYMYYSPILFSQIADLNLTHYHNSNIDMNLLNSKDRIIIFSVNNMGFLNRLMPFFFDNVKKPFIIITAMEDTQLPREIDTEFMNKLTSNLCFKHWFAINKTTQDNSHFTSIPYGLNYWTLMYANYFGEPIQNVHVQNLNLEKVINSSQHFTNRIPKIYANFHLNLTDARNGGDRLKIQTIIPTNIIFYEPCSLPRTQSWKNCSNYSFVVSPFGHGFDCIRTFEALCLGCIVIMKKSFLDIIYEGLPVLLVNEWSDINETLLNETLIAFSKKTFNYDKLKMDYWINFVNSRF